MHRSTILIVWLSKRLSKCQFPQLIFRVNTITIKIPAGCVCAHWGEKKKKNEELCLKHRKVIGHDRCSELPRAVSQREVSNLPKSP